jgi:hypothetical protein
MKRRPVRTIILAALRGSKLPKNGNKLPRRHSGGFGSPAVPEATKSAGARP